MSTNQTSNPLTGDAYDAQGALYKGIGVSLAVASGLFIGSSFVFKKKGLLQSVEKCGGVAGEGYGYLKSFMWWLGMILMIVGELCNFVAYAFTQAILVTPLGALSVVISAILSSLFLKEKLSFQGKIGCLQCIVGAIIIVLHAPVESASDSSIETFKHLVLSLGFLVYGILAVVLSLFLIFYCGPRWGKQNMLVYITICSLIGSLSVVFTQGFGAAVVHSISISNQFTNWFIYLVLIIFIITLAVEIVYLNKALNLFNTALVTPTYYVIFTTLTIVSSSVLHQGFHASGTDIGTCVLGFVVICSGVALLHNSKSLPSPDSKRLSTYDPETPTYKDRHSMEIYEGGHEEIISPPFMGIHQYTSKDPVRGHYQQTVPIHDTDAAYLLSPLGKQDYGPSKSMGLADTLAEEKTLLEMDKGNPTHTPTPSMQSMHMSLCKVDRLISHPFVFCSVLFCSVLIYRSCLKGIASQRHFQRHLF
ncbi:magnesium transporter NIPA-domain-containing protein [Spinellus fusiger]|nr:magnesium transporter NIPA-domain-containing protein [Spinellus fusiger]